MSDLRDVARASTRGSFFLFIGKSSSIITMAIASILIARLLGPENYGLYSMALIATNLLITLSDVGVSPALTRFSARLHSEGEDRKTIDLIKAGIIFKSAFSLFFSLVLLLLSKDIATWILRRPGISPLIRFTSLFLVGHAIYITLNSIFVGLDKTENGCLIMNVQAITKTVASLLLIILGMGTTGAILGTGLGSLLAAGTGLIVLLSHIHHSPCSRDRAYSINFSQGLRLMIPYGMPLYLSALTLSLLTQYQYLVLAQFVSNTKIGNYTIATYFSYLVIIISDPLATSLFAAFSKLDITEDREAVENMFKLSVKYTSLLVIPASLAVAVFSNEIVYLLFGPQYELAPSYLALYILSFLCTGLGMLVVASFFNGQGDTKATFRMDLIKLGVSVPLAFILTFLYSVPGLVVSILAAQFLSTTYGLFLARKKYTVNVDWASSLKIGITALFSALLVYIFLKLSPALGSIFKLAIGGSLYVASFLTFAPLLGAISKVDIKNLDKLLKELPLIYPIASRVLDLEERILTLLAGDLVAKAEGNSQQPV